MANYYADRIRIGSERNLGNEVTRETPQKVDLGLGVKKALLCSVKAQENNELFRFFFFFFFFFFCSQSYCSGYMTYEEMRIEIRPDAIHPSSLTKFLLFQLLNFNFIVRLD